VEASEDANHVEYFLMMMMSGASTRSDVDPASYGALLKAMV
jgi:hypothetical protein